jgi:hypothetical protein
MLPSLSRALVVLHLSGVCLANPYMLLYTGTPIAPTPTPPTDVDTNEEVFEFSHVSNAVANKPQIVEWIRANYQAVLDTLHAYLSIHAGELAPAESAISAFAATATYEMPAYVTAPMEWDGSFVSDVPAWFSELPADVQSVKIQEGKGMMAILAAGFASSHTTAAQDSTEPATTSVSNGVGGTSLALIFTSVVAANSSMTFGNGTHTPITSPATTGDNISTTRLVTDVTASTTTSTHTAKHTTSRPTTSNNAAQSGVSNAAATGYAGLIGAIVAVAAVM